MKQFTGIVAFAIFLAIVVALFGGPHAFEHVHRPTIIDRLP